MTAAHTPTGSRRMNEVNPDMYSPAERPSSIRAAPAKNLIWSTIGGISSLAGSAIGLPVFCDSAATNSSALASIASAIRSRARLRSPGVASRQPSNASAAEENAAATSVSPETGAVANASPVLGLISSARLSNAVSVHCLGAVLGHGPGVVHDVMQVDLARPAVLAGPGDPGARAGQAAHLVAERGRVGQA